MSYSRFKIKIIITILIAIFFISGISYFLLFPLVRQINKLNQDIIMAREDLAVLNAQQQDISEIRKKSIDITRKKEEASVMIVDRENLRAFVELLELNAEQSNILQVISLPDLTEFSTISEVPLNLTLTGGYHNILKYLLKIKVLDPQINIASLNLSSTDKPLNEYGEPQIKAEISAKIIWQPTN
jgi:Tfp pilus assembly protein PilO